MADTLATFRGRVRCERATRTLTLSGMAAERPDEEASLLLSAPGCAECPDSLDDAVVEHLGGGRYLIRSGAHEWPVEAEAVHLHREIARSFYRAIPPRRAPWRKRIFWRMVLALGASRAGLAALRMLRRHV